ncbi:MAG: hypothetical protein IKF18_07205 [Erysipelotrichaceae bacterium]|nr:hypothetical protein [Erysipelotrichaceae bacterium]
MLLYRKKRNLEEEIAKLKTALTEAENGLKTMQQKYDEVCQFNVKLTSENEKLKEDARLLTDTNNKLLSAYGEINKILKGVI